jgi:pimeloyl-ACP methyl ester carboxylesterase
MKKTFITNRRGQRVCVVVDETIDAKGLVFVMHGLGGNKDQLHVQTFASAFKEKGFTLVLFDTTNTFGESDGRYESATTTNYYEDLQDVITWASSQSWYIEPFWLIGHSLGAISVALYAKQFPNKVKAVAPISTVVSGKLSMTKEGTKEWQDTGWKIKESSSVPGRIKKLPWSHMEDRVKYNLLDNVKKLSMPVLLIVGEKDRSTPSEQQQLLYDSLPGKKELHIINNAPHTFKEPAHLEEIKNIIQNWIDTI